MSPWLTDSELERSAVVANCRMNRERLLYGRGSYAAELHFDPLAYLRSRAADARCIRWLDLCCGTGRALIAAARTLGELGPEVRVRIVGVDLVDYFDPVPADLGHLTLIAASVHEWSPADRFDLITCVHGLHYLGDKLGVIARALAWLQPGGRFVAHLDLANLGHTGMKSFAGQLGRWFRNHGLQYDRRRRLLTSDGPRMLDVPWRYLGADDACGPNFTGQPAVTSWYGPRESQ